MSLYGRGFTEFQIRDSMVMDLTLVALVSDVTDNTLCHSLIGYGCFFMFA